MTRATLERPRRSRTKRQATRQFRTFRSALNYLNSLVNYERATRIHYDTTHFGLARMSRLLSALCNPHQQLRTVHIAGTKGKGSTAAMLSAMLHANELKVGLYTSPHILNVRERIMIDGDKIPESAFAKAIGAVAAITEKARVTEPTYFEVLTAAAMYHFAEREVDIAVIETGMGGRLDATNVISPEVVGITSISLDHMPHLGTDLASIAREKAGIMKKGVPVISAPQPSKAREVLVKASKASEAPLAFSNEDVAFSYRFEFSRAAGRHARICLTTPTSRFEHLHVPLLGEHQAINCTLALRLLDTLKARGFEIDDHAAMSGLQNVKLAGRMQLINEDPRIIVDGAHNAASVHAVVHAIGQNVTYDSMVVIFACHKDKDVSGMIRQIARGADKIIFTSTGSPRSADPAELAAQYTEHSGKMAQVAERLEDAMRIAESAVTREDLICITGSFYIVAEAIRKFSAKPA